MTDAVAWDKGGKGGGTPFWSPVRAAQSTGRKISEAVHKSTEQVLQTASAGAQHGKERLDALSQQIRQDIAGTTAHLQDAATLSYQDIKDASVRVAGDGASSARALMAEYQRRIVVARRANASRSNVAAEQLRRNLSDPTARERALGAAALIAASTGIEALKALTVFDSETGELVSLDLLVRAMLAVLGAGALGDLAKDPLALAFLLMFDSDYLLQERIIPSPFGEDYVSIAELAGLNIQDGHLESAMEAYDRSRISWKLQGDAIAAARHAETFSIEIRLINPAAWDRSRRLTRVRQAATAGTPRQSATALLHELVTAAANRDIVKARAIRDQIVALAKPARGDRKAARAINARGMEQFGKRQFASAEELFRRAALLDPRDQEALSNLGAVLIETERLGEAEETLERVLTIDPNSTPAWLALGQLYALQGTRVQEPSFLMRAVAFIAGTLGIPWDRLSNWIGFGRSNDAIYQAREKASGAFFSALIFSDRPENAIGSLAVLAGETRRSGVKEAARITLIDSGKALESSWGAGRTVDSRSQTEDASLISLRVGLGR